MKRAGLEVTTADAGRGMSVLSGRICGWGGRRLAAGDCPQVIARRAGGMTPVLHYPLHERHNARGVSLSEARGADNASPQRARQGRPRQKSPSTGLPAAFPRKSSPGAARPAAFPRKISPNAPENSVFRPFWACRANFFALAPTIGPRRANFFAHMAQPHGDFETNNTSARLPELTNETAITFASPQHPE